MNSEPTTTERGCRHCGGSLDHRRSDAWFCSDRCRTRARRRRHAGQAEDRLNGRHAGRRGRLPLSVVTEWDRLSGHAAELRQAVRS